jgi:hypothetical protein
VLIASAVLTAAVPAQADDAPRVFPLTVTSPLPPALSGAPPELTAALAGLLDGETVQSSLEELGRKLRCDIEVSSCLDAIARSLKTTRLVFGTVTGVPGGKLKVKLVRFDSAPSGSELHQRTFVLTAQTPKRLGKQLARSAEQMFERTASEEPVEQVERRGLGAVKPERTEKAEKAETAEKTEKLEPAETVEPAEPTESAPLAPRSERAADEPAPASGGITKTTWALLGTGALVSAVGGGFLLAARSLEGDLATAPRRTVQDFQRLTAIERAGRIRVQVGSTLAIAGGAVLAVGAVRAVMQRGSKSTSLERSVALVPVEGGAAVVFSKGMR